MIELATDVVDAIGPFGVALLIALECVIPPIPSEAVLLLAGFTASAGRMSVPVAIAAATAGSVLGALALYALGALVGEDRLSRLIGGVGRFVGVSRADVDRAFGWFERHGPRVVFFGRCVPLVRSLVSIPAGADRMPIGLFCLLTALGSAAWNALWVLVGWALGDRWATAERWTEVIDKALYAAVALGLVALLVRKRRHARAARDLDRVP